jgi:hypothetical protein
MTLHRVRVARATTANLTGALSREVLEPERSLPVSVPLAKTPLAVAWKLVILAVIESLDDVPRLVGGPEFAFAGCATTAANASAEKLAATSLRIVSLLGVDKFDFASRARLST